MKVEAQYRVMKLEVILPARLMDRTNFRHIIPNIIGLYNPTPSHTLWIEKALQFTRATN